MNETKAVKGTEQTHNQRESTAGVSCACGGVHARRAAHATAQAPTLLASSSGREQRGESGMGWAGATSTLPDEKQISGQIFARLRRLHLFCQRLGMLQVVLVEPEIPPNTGNIGRLCLGAGAVLHLIEPLGFSLDDKALKRAGLDYWDLVQVRRWKSWDAFRSAQDPRARMFFLTTKSSRIYWNVQFEDGDFLVFGRETRGLPESLLRAHAPQCLTIPMEPETRSLNLATSVGIVLYEALRQLHQMRR